MIGQRPYRKYPESCAEALVIDRSASYCGNCGKDANPNQETHRDITGYNPEPGGGCGVRWKHVTSSYFGDNIEQAVRDMRPDLEWIEMFPEISA